MACLHRAGAERRSTAALQKTDAALISKFMDHDNWEDAGRERDTLRSEHKTLLHRTLMGLDHYCGGYTWKGKVTFVR